MKTTLDAVEVGYGYLAVAELDQIISGSVYKHNERGNSELEDVCINGITIDDSQRQRSTINVNVYAPDKKVKLGKEYVRVADHEKLNQVTRKIVELLGADRGQYFEGGNLWIGNISGAMPEKEIKQHKVNIRVEVRFN